MYRLFYIHVKNIIYAYILNLHAYNILKVRFAKYIQLFLKLTIFLKIIFIKRLVNFLYN